MEALHDLDEFYRTPRGQYCLRWEQQECDKLVADCFGYNALQIGASSIDFLRNNRIMLKISGDKELKNLTHVPSESNSKLRLQPEMLPIDTESVDLVVLPHTLELAEDAHSVLREVSRILIPNGRVIITGFNLTSLWGIRVGLQRFGAKPFLPAKNFMTVSQVRDWLHLLSFNVDRGAFGCYAGYKVTSLHKDKAWIEKAGDRWWPQCGAVFVLGAVKVVRRPAFVGQVKKSGFFFGRARAGVKSNKEGYTDV